MISAFFFFKFVDKNRVKKKKNPLFWGWIPGNVPYFQCSMLTAMLQYDLTCSLCMLHFLMVVNALFLS